VSRMTLKIIKIIKEIGRESGNDYLRPVIVASIFGKMAAIDMITYAYTVVCSPVNILTIMHVMCTAYE
jgi:hypothetical protein